MAAALPMASMLASGASAVAGSGTVLATFGAIGPTMTGAAMGSSLTLGGLSTGLGFLSTAFSGLQSFFAGKAEAKAEKIASAERAAELRLQAQQERTQEAMDEADRERRLRRAIAAQRASGAGILDIEGGSFKRIQEAAVGQINRESGRAALASDLRTSRLNREAFSELRAGGARAAAARSKARTGLFETGNLLTSQMRDMRSIA